MESIKPKHDSNNGAIKSQSNHSSAQLEPITKDELLDLKATLEKK